MSPDRNRTILTGSAARQRDEPRWWAHLVGAPRVDPHKYDANYPPHNVRRFARGGGDTAKRRDVYREVRRFVRCIVLSANPIKRIPSLVGSEHDVRVQLRS